MDLYFYKFSVCVNISENIVKLDVLIGNVKPKKLICIVIQKF